MASASQLSSSQHAPKEVPLGDAPEEVTLGGAPKEVPLGGSVNRCSWRTEYCVARRIAPWRADPVGGACRFRPRGLEPTYDSGVVDGPPQVGRLKRSGADRSTTQVGWFKHAPEEVTLGGAPEEVPLGASQDPECSGFRHRNDGWFVANFGKPGRAAVFFVLHGMRRCSAAETRGQFWVESRLRRLSGQGECNGVDQQISE